MRFMKAGATSQSIYLEVLDSTSTTGGRKTGLAYNTSSLTAYYVRNGGSATAITLATLAAANSAYSSGGFKEVDATNMPGVYRLDLPDAAVASGATSVVVTLKGATGMVQVSAEIQLVTFDPQDSVRMGMTALPNAAAEAAGGLFTRGTGAGQINQDANGRIDVNLKAAAGTNVTLDANNVLNVSTKYLGGTLLTARDIGASVLLSSGTGTGQLDFASGILKGNLVQINGTSIAGTGTRVADSFVAFLNVASPVLTVASVNQTGDSYARLGAPAGASVSADVAAVKSDTGTLVTRITSTLFSGITSLAQWLGLLAGKQTGDTTARTELRATGAGSGTYDETTDSQEAIRDRGDTAWTTATGFSTHTAADVWAVGTRSLTDKAGFSISGTTTTLDALQTALNSAHGAGSWATATGFSTHTAADVWSVVTRTLTAGTNIQLPANGLANVTAWTVDITGSLSGSVGSVAGAVGSVTGNVGGNVSGNVVGSVGSLATQAKADVNAEVDTALVDIGLDHLLAASVTGTDVTDNSVIAKLVSKSATADWDSYTKTTDAMEAIRDRGDSSWTTATGFSTHTAADVWSVGTRALTDKTGFTISGTTTTLDALQSALDASHGAGSWATATGFSTHSAADVWSVVTRTLTAGTNIQLPSNGLANVTAWTVNITGNLSGSVNSVTNTVNANVTQIDGNTSAAQLLSLSARTMYSGTVTGSPTTTSFVDSGTSSYGETDQFKGRIIIFYNAEHIVKEATNITAFDPDTNAFTFAALSRAPTVGDAYVIV